MFASAVNCSLVAVTDRGAIREPAGHLLARKLRQLRRISHQRERLERVEAIDRFHFIRRMRRC